MENYNSGFKNIQSKRIISTPTPAAKNAFFYIQETGIIKKEDFKATHHKDLDSYLLVAVASGSGELTFGNENFHLKAGDCFFIDCRIPHNFASSENDPWELLWIHFNGATSRQYYEYFTSQFKNVFRPSSFEKITATISEIIHVNEQNNPNTELLTSGLIVRALTLSLSVELSESSEDSALKQKLATVNAYIEENFSRDLSLEQIASDFYISKFYLTREYKKIYGKTIFQHIITCRINYGKKLLRFSDKSVEEIAHLCGFNDQSYFARQFKKSENVTCFAYRKMWRD